MCHLVGSFFSSLPCAVSLSRSSVAVGIGNKTPLISVYSVVICLFSVYYLMDVLKYIPNAVLTTVVIVNLINVLKKFKEIPKLRKSSPIDFWASVITTVSLILFGAETGLFTGILSSLILLWLALRKTQHRNIQSEVFEDQVVVSAGEAIHFVNRDGLIHRVEKLVHDVCFGFM